MFHSHLFSVAPGNVGLLQDWGMRLMSEHKNEAMETLTEENCLEEAMYLVKAGNTFFVLASARYQGEKLPTNMQRALNRRHREIMDASLVEITALPDLSNATIETLYRLKAA
jgi:hypothetical protein